VVDEFRKLHESSPYQADGSDRQRLPLLLDHVLGHTGL